MHLLLRNLIPANAAHILKAEVIRQKSRNQRNLLAVRVVIAFVGVHCPSIRLSTTSH
jgi:hypothetical protein